MKRNLEQQNKYGNTAMHYAVYKGTFRLQIVGYSTFAHSIRLAELPTAAVY